MIEEQGGAGDFWSRVADVAMESVNCVHAELAKSAEEESKKIKPS
tara:strand:- start:373 stop:507 length:135 start_codon:yes stop_codon:yes gene_type:complete